MLFGTKRNTDGQSDISQKQPPNNEGTFSLINISNYCTHGGLIL